MMIPLVRQFIASCRRWKTNGAFLLALWLFAQPALAQVEILEPPKIDPSKLTPKLLAEQLSFECNGVTVSATLNVKEKTTTRSINIGGELLLESDENVLGLCSQAKVVEALGSDGRDLVQEVADPNQLRHRVNRHYSMPHQMPNQAPWFGKRRSHMNLSIPVEKGACPDSLKRVVAEYYVLIGRLKLKELRLEKNDEWLELGEGLEVRFKTCDVNGGSVKYQLEGRGAQAERNFHGWVDQQEGLPKVAIARAALLDENGVEHSIGGGFFSTNTGGSASFGNSAELLKMRFYVATEIREMAVPIEIKDLKLPTFGDE